jgi:hypothetical protein
MRMEHRHSGLPLRPNWQTSRLKRLSDTGSLVVPLCFKARYRHPLWIHLNQVNWSVWGTLTWHSGLRRLDTGLSEKLRRIDFTQLLTQTRALFNVHGKHIFYYHATEFGDSGQCHFHFLIKNRKPDIVSNERFARNMEVLWNTSFKPFDRSDDCGGAGKADVQAYNNKHDNPAVNYCTKREFDCHGVERERYDKMNDNLERHLIWLSDNSVDKNSDSIKVSA